MVNHLDNIFQIIRTNEIANRFVKVFSVDVLVKGATFILLPVYLHLMTQNEVGTFNYLFSFIQTLTILLIFGLSTPQSKMYHDYKGVERGQLLFSIHLVFVVFLILILIPVYCFQLDFRLINFLFEQPIPYHKYRWPILLGVVTSTMSYMLLNYLLTSENIKRVQRYNLFRLFLSNGIVIAILYLSNGDKVLSRLTVYYACEMILVGCFVSVYVKQFIPCFNYKLIKKVLSFSLPVFLLALISTVQGFSDKFFVQQKTDMSALAVYTLGVTIASVCSLVIMSFQNIWLPIFFKEKNVAINFRKTKKMAKLIVIAFITLSFVMIAGIKVALQFNVIPVVYSEVLDILPFLFLSQIILAVNALLGNYFIYFERTMLGTLTGGSVYVICFALNFLLIPRYGIPGAVVSLLCGNIILITTVYLIVKGLYRKNKNRKYENFDYSIVVPE
jgi:O-antigen/teichoic acid export membrane protein